MYCKYCGKEIGSKKYCSQVCQAKEKQRLCLENYLIGSLDGHKHSRNKDTKDFVRKYILEKYNYICVLCGFSGYNEFSKKSILQIDHIDGDAGNSRPENLRPLCPNCHAMTENYMGLNRGKSSRENRYKNGKLAEVV